MALRILHCYKAYPPVLGGIENHLQQLARGLVCRGHEVEVLTTASRHRGGTFDDQGVMVRRQATGLVASSTPLSIGLSLDLLHRRAAGTGRPDVVHLHAPFPPAELTWLATMWGRHRPATVVTYHSDIVRQRWLGALHRPIERLLLRRSDAVVATSESYRRTSRQLRGLGRCAVLPLGVDVERFARHATSTPPIPGRYVLFVGRLRHYKGVDHLIRAARLLPEDLTVVVAGTGPEGPALHELAHRLRLDDRVRFLGDVAGQDLPDLYHHAVALVLPAVNRAEAFGLVQLEAMAAGIPVVSTRLGTGVDEVNLDGVTGLTVPPGDPDSLATAIEQLVTDPDLARRLGTGGLERVRADYSVEAMIDRFEALYGDVVAPRRVRHG